MSVLVRNIEMPKRCYECRFHEVYGYEDGEKRVCELDWDVRFGDEWGKDFKHPDCPLIEVPTPHGRLIDADAAYNQFLNLMDIQGAINPCQLGTILNDAPPIIESEEGNT